MKVLILSCNTGQGHNTAGRAVMNEFMKRGIECEMLDALAFDSDMTSKLISQAHAKCAVLAPKIYAAGYHIAMFMNDIHDKHSICYLANKTYAKKIYKYVTEMGYDTLVIPHVFPSESITSIKRKNKNVGFKSYFISTDYSYPPFLHETDLDGYIIPHKDLVEEFANSRVKRELIQPIGIPVFEHFCEKRDKLDARRLLGLPENKKIILVMTGSMGYGDTEELVDELLKKIPENTYIVVMGGNNEKMKSALRSRHASNNNLTVVDFTSKVGIYMDSADIVFTKPGGLSSTEAAVKGVPIIHTKPIPGWEEDNIKFFKSHGMSKSGETVTELVATALQLLADPRACEKMVEAQNSTINKHAASDICDYIISKQ